MAEPYFGPVLRILAVAAGAILATTVPSAAGTVTVHGAKVLWHSPNTEKVDADQIAAGTERLGEQAYDDHFMNTGRAPEWRFLEPLARPAATAARIEGEAVVFPLSGRRTGLSTASFPDVATPAAPFLLDDPKSRSVLVVQPFYLFRSKETRYRVSVHGADGSGGPVFDSLPTHRLAGTPGVLVAPERAGCCENMTWDIRFYNLAKGSVDAFTCPPGQCGDLVLARPEPGGPLFLAYEVFQTQLGVGSVIETRMIVVSAAGRPLAAGRLGFAARNPSVGIAPEWAACASRVLVSDGSPYAVKNLDSVAKLEDGRWGFRFETPKGPRIWAISGLWDGKSPEFVFDHPKNDPGRG